MVDHLRTRLVSGVILVIVFAAGGLVGAAFVDGARESGPAGDEAAVTSDAELSEGEAEDVEKEDRSRRNRRSWFEIAGATEEQVEYIRSEILPEHYARLEALEQDSLVRALESRIDSIERQWWVNHRELEAYYDPKRDSLLDLTRAQIRDVLDPPARQLYDSIWDASRREDEEGRRRR